MREREREREGDLSDNVKNQGNKSIKLVFFILFEEPCKLTAWEMFYSLIMQNVNANRYIKISQLFHGLLEIVFGSASVGSL